MAQRFDISSYLQANTRAFDVVRTIYSALTLFCGLLLLFLVSVAPFRGLPSLLEYVDSEKAKLDSTNGEIRALEAYKERTGEASIAESIADLYNDRQTLIAGLYCALTVAVEGTECEAETVDSLVAEVTEEAALMQVINRRRNELQAVGTGLKMPVLDSVVQPGHVPLTSVVLLGVLLFTLRAAAKNWRATLEASVEDARSAGELKNVDRLLLFGSMSAAAPLRERRLEGIRRAAVVVAHLLPAALHAALLVRHQYLLRNGLGDWSTIAVGGYLAGLSIVAWVGVSSANQILQARSVLQALRTESLQNRSLEGNRGNQADAGNLTAPAN